MKTCLTIVQLKLSIVLSALIAATPYTMVVSASSLTFDAPTVLAKDGNNGNANGGGNGPGNAGGNGGGNGNQGANKSETHGNNQGSKDKGIKGQDGAGLSVRHDDGISEAVRNGRYIMKDSKGRTIINRRATLADEVRLRFFP